MITLASEALQSTTSSSPLSHATAFWGGQLPQLLV
jgi:hypothetical protein